MEKSFSIECTNLVKVYGKDKFRAVDRVNLSIQQGEVFGLIGPDGSGKTSIFRMLTTLLLPDEGNAKVLGYDVVKEYQEVRNKAGYMPGKFSLYQDLTVEENLNFFASVFNTTVKENYHLIEDIYVQLEPFKKRRAGKLSGGMKQKLALCCALIHKPEVLFLDEPTTGVDPVSRKEFWQMLKRLKEQGITILVATPYMDEASLCDRIALINGGNILETNTPEAICTAYPHHLLKMKSDNMQELILATRELPEARSCFGFGDYAHAAFEKSPDINKMQAYFKEKGYRISYD